MKKKLNNHEADAISKALIDVVNLKTEIPVKTGFKIAWNADVLAKATDVYHKERDRIIRSLAPDGQNINKKSDPDLYQKCTDKLTELSMLEIEVDIKELEMSEIENLEFPIKQMFALMFITKKEGDD